MAEREHYEVDVNGIKHTFLLTAEDAKRRYPGAKQVEDPAAGSDAEKLRQEFNDKANSRPAEGEGEQVQTSPSVETETGTEPGTEPGTETDSDAEQKGKTPANKSRTATNKTA